MSCRVWDTAPQWQCKVWLSSTATHWWVDVADLLAAADVDFVVVVFRGLAVNGVIEVHALGIPSPPVAPHQVTSGTHQADDHYWNDNSQNRNRYIATKEEVVISTASSMREIGIGPLYAVAVGNGCRCLPVICCRLSGGWLFPWRCTAGLSGHSC